MDAAAPIAYLLDLDDTLIDFTGNQRESWRLACLRAADVLVDLDVERAHATVLLTGEQYWGDPERHQHGRRDLRAASAEIFRLAMASLDVDVTPVFAREVADYFRDLREAGVTLFPGSIERLEALRAEGYALALVTNGTSADQRAKIERFDLERHFDHVQIEGEFGAGKPASEVYCAALEALDVSASEASFVGDHIEWDVLAPQRMGMRGVWVSAGRALAPNGDDRPNLIIERFADLP